MSANTTGPAELRWLADGEAANDGRGLSPDYLRDLAAAWEADIARAERAEAARAQARALLRRVFPACSGFVDDSRYCGQPAKWRAEWSDRSATVCDEHKPQVQRWYDGDHEYDKTGLYFEQIDMADEVAAALSAPDGAR